MAPTTLAEELKAFREWLWETPSKKTRRLRAASTVLNTANRVRDILLESCGFRYPEDIDGTRVRAFLEDLERTPDDASPSEKTSRANGARVKARAIKQFTSWIVTERRRLSNDPLGALVVGAQEPNRLKATLTDEEVFRLIETTEASTETYRRMDGPARALLYDLSLGCGLRLREAAFLRRDECLNLDESEWDGTMEPQIQLRDREFVKNKSSRRPVPIPHDLARRLAARFRELGAASWLLFPRVGASFLGHLTPTSRSGLPWLGFFLRDLQAASIGTLTERGVVKSDGCKIVFHSLRATYGKRLACCVPMAEVSGFMRHSSIETTARFYTVYGISEKARSIELLPPTRRQQSSGMGTEQATARLS